MLQLLVFLLLASPALAQERHHPPEDIAIHEQFYSTWQRPDNRFQSCCNNQDCAPVQHVRWVNGELQMQRTLDGVWLTIPKERMEQNVQDARDSPDGRSHMCSSGNLIFCAVLGNGM